MTSVSLHFSGFVNSRVKCERFHNRLQPVEKKTQLINQYYSSLWFWRLFTAEVNELAKFINNAIRFNIKPKSNFKKLTLSKYLYYANLISIKIRNEQIFCNYRSYDVSL